MPYSKQPVKPHRFISYPTGHAITSDSCVRCGRPFDTVYHNTSERKTRIRWKRLFGAINKWAVYGGAWKS